MGYSLTHTAGLFEGMEDEAAQIHHEIYDWIPLDDKSKLPVHALVAGKDQENDVFVGRGVVDGGILIGKYHSKYGGLYVGHNGKEEEVWDCIEILCVAKDAEVKWQDAATKNLPEETVDTHGAWNTFVGRAIIDGVICPGGISWRDGLHASYGGREEVLEKFQALVITNANPAYGWVPGGRFEDDVCIAGDCIHVSNDVFVGRVSFLGKIRLAKVNRAEEKIYVAHGGKEEEVVNAPFELLQLLRPPETFEWESFTDGKVPAKAILATIVDGHPQFVGRGNVGGEVCFGAIVPADGCMYVPYGGNVETLTEYEALVIQ